MPTDLDNLTRLDKSYVKAAGRMITRAFQDYPLMSYFIPDTSERKSKLHYNFEAMIRYGMTYGEVYATSPNLEGVAVWLHSENAEMTTWRMFRAMGFLILSIYFRLGKQFFSRAMSFIDFTSSIHKRYVSFPHWYLLLLGVDPTFQGKGFASKLLSPMLARIDQEHHLCYLETQKEKNVSIYEHFGFKTVDEAPILDSGVTNWAMLREKASK